MDILERLCLHYASLQTGGSPWRFSHSEKNGLQSILPDGAKSFFEMYPHLEGWAALSKAIVISNSKGLSETLRDIRTSKYQSCRSEENNKSNNNITK